MPEQFIPSVTGTMNGTTTSPLDLDQYRLAQNFADVAGVKKVLVRLPVRKPDRQWFVRTHPDREYRMSVGLLELKEDREYYLVHELALPGCMTEVQPCVLYTAISRTGVLFVWPCRLPNKDGRDSLWWASGRDAAMRAMTTWVSVRANTDVGAYELFEATADIPEPEWPDYSFAALLGLAFKDRISRDPDHPVLLKLQGRL